MNRTPLHAGAGWHGYQSTVVARRSDPPLCGRNRRKALGPGVLQWVSLAVGVAPVRNPIKALRGSPGFPHARSAVGQAPAHTPAALKPGASRRGPLKRTSCPQYSVPQAELRGRVLSLSVWHRESLGRNIFLGEVEVPLDTWDWDSEPTWLPLQPRVRQPARVGRPHRAFPQRSQPPPSAEPPPASQPQPPPAAGSVLPAGRAPSGSGDPTP